MARKLGEKIMRTIKKYDSGDTFKVVYLEAVLMPNGELITEGQTIGFIDKVGKYVHEEV